MARQTKQQRKESARQRDRLRILLDVVAQLDAKKFIAEQGVYVKFDEAVRTTTLRKGGDMQDALPKLISKAKPCRICAIGGCFLSMVNLFDKVNIKDVLANEIALSVSENRRDVRHDVDHKSIREKLGVYFGELELGVIEAAFEDKANFIGGESNHYAHFSEEQEEREAFEDARLLRALLDSIYSTGDRLRWIMNAAANLVHTGKAISVRGLKDQSLVSLGSDERFVAVKLENDL